MNSPPEMAESRVDPKGCAPDARNNFFTPAQRALGCQSM